MPKSARKMRIALTAVLNWLAILLARYNRNVRNRSVADIQQATSPRWMVPAGLGIWTDLVIVPTSNGQKPLIGLNGMLVMECRRPILWIALSVPLAMLSCTTEQRTAPSQNGDVPAFDDSDTNHDGVVILEEWDQSSARLFDKFDTDRDGQGSPEELARAFDSFDHNHDGEIEGHEAPIAIALGDADGDRLVGREEFKSINWTRETIDTDRDGTVSRREFREARRTVFNSADLDRDGNLRRHELDDAATIFRLRF